MYNVMLIGMAEKKIVFVADKLCCGMYMYIIIEAERKTFLIFGLTILS